MQNVVLFVEEMARNTGTINMYNMNISATPQAMWIEDGFCQGCEGLGWITVQDTKDSTNHPTYNIPGTSGEEFAEKSLPIAQEPLPPYDYTIPLCPSSWEPFPKTMKE